jgi:hypothetical protein
VRGEAGSLEHDGAGIQRDHSVPDEPAGPLRPIPSEVRRNLRKAIVQELADWAGLDIDWEALL